MDEKRIKAASNAGDIIEQLYRLYIQILFVDGISDEEEEAALRKTEQAIDSLSIAFMILAKLDEEDDEDEEPETDQSPS